MKPVFLPRSQKLKSFDEKLHDTLRACQTSAQSGRSRALEALALLKRTVSSASQQITSEINKLQNSPLRDRDVSTSLESQLNKIRGDLEQLPIHLSHDIDELSSTGFAITVFGRTMAGKSTLMEILTHGNGSSIGKGSQRTTRDVRTYTYKELQITDVPGIAAFEGKDDEQVAFEAAQKSDLVIFLITDDAPQAAEAECLQQILALGKPVVCLINAKANLASPSALDFKLFKRDLAKKMDSNHLDEIKNQFLAFGAQYGQEWKSVRFAYVHLKSAYLAQQPEYQAIKDELYYLSRFSYVEQVILDEVCSKGSFYKSKAFTDTVIVPLLKTEEVLFTNSAQNSEQGTILIRKHKDLMQWSDNFEKSAKERIESFLSQISQELRNEVSSFAEYNYDNSNASDAWQRVIESKHINERAETVLKQLHTDCSQKLDQLQREINAEIKYNQYNFDQNLFIDKITNWRKVWGWAATAIGAIGGVLLAIGGLAFAPFALVGVVVSGILSFFGFKFTNSYESKVQRAREKLANQLNENIDKIIYNLRKKMNDILYQNLIKGQLRPMIKTMSSIVDSVFTLSRVQRESAIELNIKSQEINQLLIKEAIAFNGLSLSGVKIIKVARIPGYALMLVIPQDTKFPKEASKALSYLLKEKVWFVIDNNNLYSMLRQAIGHGCERDQIRIQKVKNQPLIAHINDLEHVDASTQNRIRLAQQLTQLLIMK